MAHENPWFLITRSELLMIEERLDSIRKEGPSGSSRHLRTIAGIVTTVRERQP